MEKTAVLLADDHAVVRAGIRSALLELPQIDIVGEVADGPALEQALQVLTPDLLLIDVAMPSFEPISTIRAIRATHPSMKILVVSAHDDDVYVQGLLAVGVQGYHLKDQPLSDLQLAVGRVMNGERWLSSRLLNRLLTPSKPTTPISLTSRQRDIVALLLQGLDNRNIARETGLSIKTVENHLTRLYRQLNVQSRLEAVSFIHQHPELLGQESGGLPAGSPPATRPRPTPPPVRDNSTAAQILLVDDNPRFRHQLRRMVTKLRPQAGIQEADSISSAIHAAQKRTPALALVDVVLGDESGIQCVRELKQLSPNMRVVLITAYPDREFRHQGLANGAAALIDKKHLDAATMRQILDDILP